MTNLAEKSIAIIIPDFDHGGEETRVVFFANSYVQYFSKVYVISPSGASNSLLNAKVEHIQLDVRKLSNLLNVLKLLKDNQIDYLQGHKRLTMPYLWTAEKVLGTKSFFNFDNIYLTGNRLCSYISPKRLVYLSDVLKDFYQKYYPNSINTTINMGGAFLEPFISDRKEYLKKQFGAENSFVILSLGRLSEQKNHQLLIKALANIKEENFICLVAGKGHLEEEMKTLSRTSGISDKVRFLGHRKDVDILLNVADVLVQTSIFEGFPNVFIEATSVGLPIVATNVGSARTLIKGNGILVNTFDDSEVSHAILQLMNNQKRYQREAKNLRNSLFFQSFTKEKMLENYLAYIREL